ncbi:hypothetical protein K0M31_016615 [Melipona bicolor]|uniref:Uncharacterized protein n=1 Tax=Melipona bicolor TaxID=60889 RepID=A0AA40KEH9_9HYME|nr:hypothetical protein K0M31_016615 [Melipona bicolor]
MEMSKNFFVFFRRGSFHGSKLLDQYYIEEVSNFSVSSEEHPLPGQFFQTSLFICLTSQATCRSSLLPLSKKRPPEAWSITFARDWPIVRSTCVLVTCICASPFREASFPRMYTGCHRSPPSSFVNQAGGGSRRLRKSGSEYIEHLPPREDDHSQIRKECVEPEAMHLVTCDLFVESFRWKMPKMPACLDRLNDFVVGCSRVINETFDVSEHGFLLLYFF